MDRNTAGAAMSLNIDEFDDSIMSDDLSNSSSSSGEGSSDFADDESSFLVSDSNSNECMMSDTSSDNNITRLILPIIQNKLNVLSTVANNLPAMISFCNNQNDVPKKWGGSPRGKKGSKDRNFEEAYKRIMKDCFSGEDSTCTMKDYFSGEDSTYNEIDFERRFRISRNIFEKIYTKFLESHCLYIRKTLQKNGEFILCVGLLLA